MAEHPIQGLMTTAMENIKEMVDVNTIIGDAVETPDGSIIIPVSRVGFGFAAGGSEFGGKKSEGTGKDGSGKGAPESSKSDSLPFGGGSGGGVSITPIGFLVVSDRGIRMLNIEGSNHLYDRLIDLAPNLMEKVQGMMKGGTKKGDHAASKPSCSKEEAKEES
ncbi:GerW family sporulation protein [Marininema halotolerans]|uniref:Sporulation protein YtfJ n=1 Tax=Marininema halotolerans TaxID=1155944 RepID=A0A1I6TRN5_9BACL|nr:GerW family sporulation protein [Marininema halotolerans]SFS91889.1 sporulation protein YtfJ [Marininema halotolerans]